MHILSQNYYMRTQRHLLAAGWQRLLSALLPGVCTLCRQESDNTLCTSCKKRYFAVVSTRCQQCAVALPPQAGSRMCGDCLQHPPAFDQTITACDYTAPQDQLVLALKFGHQLALADLCAALLRDAILSQQTTALPDLLCVVPLSANRLAGRGFNQSMEIARPLARQLGIPLQTTMLKRTRDTLQQSSLPPEARIHNVKQAFTIDTSALELIQGAHIAVIDDVITTGMTLHEIATMLKRFGAAKITNYVFARTPLHFS